jgi:hypothetical protein
LSRCGVWDQGPAQKAWPPPCSPSRRPPAARSGPPAYTAPSPHRSTDAGCTTAPSLHQTPAPDTAGRTSPPAHSWGRWP